MTRENYTCLSDAQIIEKIDEFKKSPFQIVKYIRGHQKDLYCEILNRTRFLDDGFYSKDKVPLQARIHCLRNNLHQHPICQNPNCPNHNFVGWRFGKTNNFAKYCSLWCAENDNVVKQKKIKTCQSHYSVDNPFQSEIVKFRIKNTLLKKYGVLNSMDLEWVREKIKQTLIKTYGVENPMQSEIIRSKLKSKMMEKYGVENCMHLDWVKNKIRYKCYQKYGVDNFSKTPEFHIKYSRRYFNSKYPDMTFDSSWEFKVYDFLKEFNIDFSYQPIISIPYEYDGKTYTYHPDFLIKGKYYEVKGDWFFRKNKLGREEMFHPWRYKDESDSEYNWKCGKAEAKHQCMIANDVMILRQKDIDNISDKLSGVVNTPQKPIPQQPQM